MLFTSEDSTEHRTKHKHHNTVKHVYLAGICVWRYIGDKHKNRHYIGPRFQYRIQLHSKQYKDTDP